MRRVIVASLALFPMLLHAQANTPAQPQASSYQPTLQAKLAEPMAFNSANDSNSKSTSDAAAPLRISSGVVAPKLTYTVDVPSNGDLAWKVISIDRTAVVEMIVDVNGKPSDLKIVESVGPTMDKNVLDAVSQYRFKPGTLDDQPTAVPVTLHLVMRSSAR